ncbi:nicotinate-nucleotide--dimethylbenzimidazole phosphoribosyltransferase, partial [Frankia sp. CNm7]|uniref:nicotinate-nucleotide--dimethylbenzimidazole phosphoribosyltransferase n=1 Tax=Frankia nepalensis TaxID=1836974 RepID=UPI00193408AE
AGPGDPGAESPAGPPAKAGYRVRPGNGRIDREDALSVAEVDRALAVGRRLADEEIDAGAAPPVTGALGGGADTAAAVGVAALRDAEPIDVVDRGDGGDDERWMLRTAAIRDALRRTRPFATAPRSVLRVAGGADLAALAGLLVQAALRRTPVIIDGRAACAAALAAERMAPGARAWWLVGGDCPDPAARQAVAALGLTPLVDLGIRAEDGTGALAAAALAMVAVETAADLEAAAAAAPLPGGVDTADVT